MSLTKQGKSVSYIIDYIQNPVVTEQYVNKVIKQCRRIHKKYPWKENCRRMTKQTKPPKPNTMSRIIYDRVTQTMGLDVFYQRYTTESIRLLAEEMQLPYMNLRRFFQGFFTGRLNHHPNYFAGTKWNIDTIHKYRKEKKLDKSTKPTTYELEEMKKLF